MDKQFDYVVVSGYSCLDKLSPKTRRIHLRKFISKKLMNDILFVCKDLQEISLPKHISEKINADISELLEKKSITVSISENSPGRPNILDNMIKMKRLEYDYKMRKEKLLNN